MKWHEQPSAVATPPQLGEPMTEEEREQLRERFWQAADRIRERNADKDPDEEFAFITEVVEDVWRERRARDERDRRPTAGGR